MRGQTNVRDVLVEIVKTGRLEHQIAAAFALHTMTRGKTQAAPLLEGKVRDAAGQKYTASQIQAMIQREQEAVFGNSTEP